MGDTSGRSCATCVPRWSQATEEVTDPTHWAVLMVEEVQLVAADTGDPVDDDDVDWSTEHHPEREPREGHRHAAGVVEKTVLSPQYYCLDPSACGLTSRSS